MWIDRSSTFALRNDGSIYLWQVDLAKEWSSAIMTLNVCAGAIVLFIPTLIAVLFNWFLSWIHGKQKERMSIAAYRLMEKSRKEEESGAE